MITIKNVLVATDFSGVSESAMNYGRAMAQSFGAKLHVLHVVEPVWITSADIVGAGVALPTMVEGLEAAARTQLEAAVTDADRRDLHAVPVLITSESPAREIADYAKEHDVDLVVIGAHEHSAIARLFLGSEAEKAVRMTSCPVLIVHHHEHEFVLPDAIEDANPDLGLAAS